MSKHGQGFLPPRPPCMTRVCVVRFCELVTSVGRDSPLRSEHRRKGSPGWMDHDGRGCPHRDDSQRQPPLTAGVSDRCTWLSHPSVYSPKGFGISSSAEPFVCVRVCVCVCVCVRVHVWVSLCLFVCGRLLEWKCVTRHTIGDSLGAMCWIVNTC